jgi:hypothetical protein
MVRYGDNALDIVVDKSVILELGITELDVK